MTARRRRKSGCGPSATALIAWAGGARARTDTSPADGWQPLVASVPYSRRPLIVRGRGLAAGTLLACGSVLAVAVHTADSSLTPPPRLATAGPHSVSGGATAPLVVIERWAAAATTGSGQELGGTYIPSGGAGHPVSLALHASGSSPPEATLLLPLNLPGVSQTQAPESIDRTVAPVPEASVVESSAAPVAQHVVAPALALFTQQRATEPDLVVPVAELTAPAEQSGALEEGAQPAMTMLSPPLLVQA